MAYVYMEYICGPYAAIERNEYLLLDYFFSLIFAVFEEYSLSCPITIFIHVLYRSFSCNFYRF
jgi:hypothetical protein